MFSTRFFALIALAAAVNAAPTGGSHTPVSISTGDGHDLSVDINASIDKRTSIGDSLTDDLSSTLDNLNPILGLDAEVHPNRLNELFDKRTSSGDLSALNLDDLNLGLDAEVHPDRLNDLFNKRTSSGDDHPFNLPDANVGVSVSGEELIDDLFSKRTPGMDGLPSVNLHGLDGSLASVNADVDLPDSLL
ncbi:unnamed protein product [Peniophora sp. CBMAI 1063]|nr:unnamed protein product [Peniophora sp. CBMAI 1063]